MCKRLKRSGYNADQAREILISGVRGYKAKCGRGEIRHRRSHETEGTRRFSKLIGKKTWFKTRFPDQKDPRRPRGSNHSKPPTCNSSTPQPSSVPLTPRTHNGELVNLLRSKEREINKVSRRSIKILEKTGTQVQRILTKSDSWGEPPCP